MNTTLSTTVKVSGFLLALVAVFGLALAVGARVGRLGEPTQAHTASDATPGSSHH